MSGVNLNRLDYRETAAFDLSFELLVDGQLISTRIGASDTAIPYWLIVTDLPPLAADDEDYAPDVRILAVAACCGEYGCGHARCRLVVEGDTIVFRDFAGEGNAEGQAKFFRFSRSNYGDVVGEMAGRSIAQARIHRSKQAKPAKSH